MRNTPGALARGSASPVDAFAGSRRPTERRTGQYEMCRQALAEELGVEPGLETVELTAVHAILTGRVEAATALAELETRLVEITGFRVGSPR